MDRFRYLFAGGGMVAGYAAQELALLGLGGAELGIITADDTLPYERPPLSKDFLASTDVEPNILINDAAFYAEHGITVRLNTTVAKIDPARQLVRLDSGEEVGYEHLVLATGCAARRMDVPGSDLDGVHYLRSARDSRDLRKRMATHAVPVVIGSGFIAMEVASVLAGRGLAPVMVFPEERVWKRLFTPGISRFFERYFVERGVRFEPNETVVAFVGEARVERVRLKSGRELRCGVAVAGVGAVPMLDLAREAGLQVGNGIVVNEYLETSVPGVYAAGDIAAYPDLIFNRPRRAEHWDNAVEHGKHIAHVLTGDRKPFRHVPYFFSDVFDLSYEYWGDSEGATSAVTIGSKDESSFSTWWLDGEGRVVAAFVLNRPDEERDAAVALIEGHQPLPDSWHGEAEALA